MGLDIILEACETKIFYENEGYFNLETEDEIPFNEDVRCEPSNRLRMIMSYWMN